MALSKVRALHPDFFSDEDVAEVSIPARLLFAGLWCFACDNGHLADKPKQIKRWIYATDDVNTAALLRELEAQGLIERDGEWIVIPNLAKRQRVDYRYFKACERKGCVKPPKKADSQPETRRGNGGATQSHAVATRGPATDGDGDGDGVRDGEGDVAARKGRKRRIPTDYSPNDKHLAYAAEHHIDLEHELARFIGHAQANGRLLVDWDAGFRNWLASDFTRKLPASTNVHRLPHASQLAEPPNGLTDAELDAWYRGQR